MATTVVEHRSHPAARVAESARLCVESFQTCLDKTALVHCRELSLVEDQLARFSLWAASIHVFGPSRSSLDQRLREAPDVQDAAVALLQALSYRVRSCSSVLDSISSNKTRDATESVSKEFEEALGELADKITLLHKLSNTIRRASKDAQNAEAANAFTIRDDEGNDVESFQQDLFAKYIHDQFPGTSDKIQQRLAKTMVLRRKRILYRKARYGKTPIHPREVPSQPSIVPPKPKITVNMPQESVEQGAMAELAKSESIVQSVAHTATTLNPESFRKASNPSVISVSKPVALSTHDELSFPPAPCGAPMRKYNKLKKEREKQHREFLEKIPDYKDHEEIRPRYRNAIATNELNNNNSLEKEWDKYLEAIREVRCPFCLYTIPIRDAMDEKKWRLHVKSDLDPYVCLFGGCNAPEQLYSHSGTWREHMREHAMQWRCTSKSHGEFVSNTREDYVNHFKVSHPGQFNEAQLGVLARKNARLNGPLFKSCPLCGVEDVEGSMESHVEGHLRFLALKSLPSYQEDTLGLDDEPDDETNSQATSRPHSRSTVKNDPDRHERPAFSEMTSGYQRPSGRQTPSKYAAWGGFRSYILRFPEGMMLSPGEHDPSSPTQSTPSAFNPPPILPIDEVGSLDDPSSEFVDETILLEVSKGERRHFEWGFIPDAHDTCSPKDDPILQAFHENQKNQPNSSGRVISINPDCAICHSPADAACDCEAKALEVALAQAEKKVMGPVYRDVREWARLKSQDLVLGQYRLLRNSPRQPDITITQQDNSVENSNIGGPSQQEINEMWHAATQRYPGALEYYFSLTELTLPAEDEPVVRDPLLSALNRTRATIKRPSEDSAMDQDSSASGRTRYGNDNEPRKRGKGHNYDRVESAIGLDRSVTGGPSFTPLPLSPFSSPTPLYIRTSTINNSSRGSEHSPNSYTAILKNLGKLDTMAENWTSEEWDNRRRIVCFQRTQFKSSVIVTFHPVSVDERPPNSICISCIWWADKNECCVTQVDIIHLLEQLLAIPNRFSVEQKNRIRRGLEPLNPLIVDQSEPESKDFFKIIMDLPNPKPRNIEKDIKVFPWKVLKRALKTIFSKYSTNPDSTLPPNSTPGASNSSPGISRNLVRSQDQRSALVDLK